MKNLPVLIETYRYGYNTNLNPELFFRGSARKSGETTMPSQTEWTFAGTWPYTPRWFQTPDGQLHYIDEGPRDGRPIILVHGNPTWGYIWRNFIPPLVSAGYRVIIPDHLGFGRSDKPDDPSLYHIPRHAARLEQFLESLDLANATVVCQDWGGPIGLAWAARHPDRVHSLAIMNTLAHRPSEKVPMPLSLRLIRYPILGEIFIKGLHAFVRVFLFRGGTMHPDRLGPNERNAYLAPHPDWASRTSVLVFPREIPAGPDGAVSAFIGSVHDGLMAMDQKPVFIAWGMKDFAFLPAHLDDLWLVDFPHAKVLRLADAGHFVQEDAHEVIVPALVEFLNQPEDAPPHC